ncbi:energy-coupling factor transporter transmembrane component T family protein [Nocardioides yefusunii]|uniref:Energy-coupling factor transporter transmembrane component T family protein n=1 Tax=Nocardioides yefusunii TaxID=2500546 RepID=A0ABW1QY77_9ACTN|nr:energy-coupling factor transporter transmembrane protein EcfT [Nocardioides yefusunii]
MSTTSVLGSYTPGTTWLHRLGAGTKLAALFVAGIVVVWLSGWLTAAGALAVALGLVLAAGVRPRQVWTTLRSLLVLCVILVAYSLWRSSWQVAFEQVGDLVALVLLSLVLTATTAVDDILDVVVRLLTPLRRVGVNPERVALAFSLVIRTVPLVFELAAETRDAARARGLERDPRVWLVPFVLRAVAHARDTGDALHARGLGDD